MILFYWLHLKLSFFRIQRTNNYVIMYLRQRLIARKVNICPNRIKMKRGRKNKNRNANKKQTFVWYFRITFCGFGAVWWFSIQQQKKNERFQSKSNEPCSILNSECILSIYTFSGSLWSSLPSVHAKKISLRPKSLKWMHYVLCTMYTKYEKYTYFGCHSVAAQRSKDLDRGRLKMSHLSVYIHCFIKNFQWSLFLFLFMNFMYDFRMSKCDCKSEPRNEPMQNRSMPHFLSSCAHCTHPGHEPNRHRNADWI